MTSRKRTTYLVKMCELVTRAGIEEALRDLDVSGLQYMILSSVGGGRGPSVADLARASRVAPQSMNEFVANLEAKGLVARSPDPSNRRILRAFLTPDGAQLLKMCDRRMDKLERDLFGVLTAEELSAFRDIFQRILAHADANAQANAK